MRRTIVLVGAALGAMALGGGRAEARPARPVYCPMIYAPVCGVKNGRRRIYSNSCMAKAAGARTVRGSCG